MSLSSIPDISIAATTATTLVVVTATILSRLLYSLYFHPLAKYPGPWYARATSLPLTIISLRRVEPQWLISLAKRYGTEGPIRIAPTLLLFPNPEHMRDIYWDPKCNTKADLYGSGALGPPSLFSTQDGEKHRRLRRALGGSQWTIGSLKKTWEPRLDELITLFTEKMTEFAQAREEIMLCDKVAEFAADFLTMIAFNEPWGFVRNGRDEREYLKSWREGLDFYGLAARWKSFRKYILKNPILSSYFLPSVSDKHGMGYLAFHADQQVSKREAEMEESGGEWKMDNPDFLQHALNASFSDGSILTPVDKRANITFLIQAGADTTGTGMGSTLRYLLIYPDAFKRARAEIEEVDKAGKLSRPISYEESRRHLPYLNACIKESLRLDPPTPQLLPRVVPAGGKRVGNVFVPGGTDVTTHASVVQRDPVLYAPDPGAFRPERWLDPTRESEMEAASFVFGMGPRVCIGKDVSSLETWKLLPEIIRNFDIELRAPGEYVVAGGVAFNEGLRVVLTRRCADQD
ncbi:cytochrome P450 [Biscogniauxia marginata]|nr:cytochrome P450 [Biscogniauxia marginata]